MNKIIETLNWRYATKKFDPKKKINETEFETILEALRLSPSSFWVQPWKFFVIENEEIRKKLQEASFWQSQVVDASHYIVFSIPEKLDNQSIDRYLEKISSERWVDRQKLEEIEARMKNYITNMSEDKKQTFSALQVFIALWNILTVAATMRIDTCTIWWIEEVKYDEILWLKEKGYKSIIACAFWYRSSDDFYGTLKKVRFDKDDVIEII